MTTFFTDRDLGKQLPAILKDAGIEVERHCDLFAQDGLDEEWLEYCGTKALVAISHDQRIRYQPNEKAAVIEFKVPLFILIGQVPTAVLARNFVNTLVKIELMLAIQTPPFIAKVYLPYAKELVKNPDAPGRVEIWYPEKKP